MKEPREAAEEEGLPKLSFEVSLTWIIGGPSVNRLSKEIS